MKLSKLFPNKLSKLRLVLMKPCYSTLLQSSPLHISRRFSKTAVFSKEICGTEGQIQLYFLVILTLGASRTGFSLFDRCRQIGPSTLRD